MRVQIAGCTVEVSPQYDYTVEFLKEYAVSQDTPLTGDFPVLAVSEEEILREQEGYSELFERGYLESLALLRKLAEALSAAEAVLFHGVALEWQGRCYLIAARSGTGKSTHAFLWQRYLKQVRIINGDKPFIRKTDNGFLVYGTPWCGKEGLHVNTQAKLAAIIFLDRGEQCAISRLGEREAVARLLSQVHVTDTGAAQVLHVCDAMLGSVPCYHLACDMSRNAVKVCFEAVTGLDFEKYAEKG